MSAACTGAPRSVCLGSWLPTAVTLRRDIPRLGLRVPVSPGRKEDRQQRSLSAQAGTPHGNSKGSSISHVRTRTFTMPSAPWDHCHFKGGNCGLPFFSESALPIPKPFRGFCSVSWLCWSSTYFPVPNYLVSTPAFFFCSCVSICIFYFDNLILHSLFFYLVYLTPNTGGAQHVGWYICIPQHAYYKSSANTFNVAQLCFCVFFVSYLFTKVNFPCSTKSWKNKRKIT